MKRLARQIPRSMKRRQRITTSAIYTPAPGTLINFDVTDQLNEIDVPILFLTGQFDEARPEAVADFQKLVPGSQFTVIMDAGHASLSKKPEEYRTILENFLDLVENKKR